MASVTIAASTSLVEVNLPNTCGSVGNWCHQLRSYIFDPPPLFLGGLGAHVPVRAINACTTISYDIGSLFQGVLGATVSYSIKRPPE